MIWKRRITKPSDALTPREWEVIICACVHGFDAPTIADRLYVTDNAVYVYLSHIYAKLGVDRMDGLRDWYRAEYPPTGLHARDYDDPDFDSA